MSSSPPHDYPDVTGVLLAGGKSTRMGRDKALLELDGRRLADRMLEFLAALFPRVLIAGDRPDLERPGLPSFPDPFPGSSLGGIHNGLLHSDTPLIFVAPCDLPSPNLILAEALLAFREGNDVVIPLTPQGYEPLFGLYGRNCLPQIEAMLAGGSFRILDLYPRVRTRALGPGELPEGWEGALRNLNTPEDLRNLKKDKPC